MYNFNGLVLTIKAIQNESNTHFLLDTFRHLKNSFCASESSLSLSTK